LNSDGWFVSASVPVLVRVSAGVGSCQKTIDGVGFVSLTDCASSCLPIIGVSAVDAPKIPIKAVADIEK